MGNNISVYDDNHHNKLRINAKLSQFIKTKFTKNNQTGSNCNDDFIIKYSQYNKLNENLINIENLDQKRLVFVSLIGLYQSWKDIPSISLYSCLLIMPLKSKWIYHPSKYIKEYVSEMSIFSDVAQTKQFIELLKWKNSQGLVFWMLDDYKYPSVSTKLPNAVCPFWYYLSTKLSTLFDPITGHKYKPLNLDEKWWENTQTFHSKFDTKYIDIKNELYCLSMRYKAIQEIIYQSNPNSLRPVTVYKKSPIKQNLFVSVEIDNGIHKEKWFISSDYDL